jgi:hypothetical protein
LAGLRVEAPTEEPVLGDLRLVTQVGRVFERKHPDVRVVLDRAATSSFSWAASRHAGSTARTTCATGVRQLVAGETAFRTVAPPAGHAPGARGLVIACAHFDSVDVDGALGPPHRVPTITAAEPPPCLRWAGS